MASQLHLFRIFLVTLASISALVAEARVFKVGGETGWCVPETNTSFYVSWASRLRFQVGDSLSFEYNNDSVYEVDSKGFDNCDTSNSVIDYSNNGTATTVINLDRPGAFYFISGNTDHCSNGQKLIVDVMSDHHRHHNQPGYVAAPPRYESRAPFSQPSSGVSVSATGGLVAFGLVVASVFGFPCY